MIAQNREALRGNGEPAAYEVGETGDLGDDVFVGGGVEEEDSAIVSEPIAALLGEAVANHLVDEVRELRGDRIDHLRETCVKAKKQPHLEGPLRSSAGAS